MKLLKRDQNPKLRLTALCAMPSVTQREMRKIVGGCEEFIPALPPGSAWIVLLSFVLANE